MVAAAPTPCASPLSPRLAQFRGVKNEAGHPPASPCSAPGTRAPPACGAAWSIGQTRRWPAACPWRDRRGGRPHQRAVVGHQAPGVAEPVVTADHAAKAIQDRDPVHVVIVDPLAPVAARNDEVQRTDEFESRWSGPAETTAGSSATVLDLTPCAQAAISVPAYSTATGTLSCTDSRATVSPAWQVRYSQPASP